MRAIAQARVSAAQQQAEVVRRGLGDTELLDRVLDADEQIFGDPRPQYPAPASAVAPVAARRQMQEDDQPFEEIDFLDGKDGR
jgi:hypothetical protein